MTSQEFSKEILEKLKNIEILLTSIAKAQLYQLIVDEMKDEARQIIYQRTGSKTVKEIANEAGVAVGTISTTWAKWEQMGIVYKDGKSFRKVLE